ncbi:MAG: ribosome maturation factor RimM [Treponema sp.]|jgi:16S rRNA processing protein RimM|nr:ribosome maturation factor RimM [Treponema sp.]
MTERFVVALVGPPFGLQGFVKVQSLSGEIQHLLKPRCFTLRQGDREQVWELEAVEPMASSLLMKFRGIDSPEAAKTLKGAEILLKREDAAPLQPGEYYIEDLKGVEVYAGTETLGTITGILEGGGGNLAELCLKTGETRLIPFRDEFLGDIDLKGRRVELLCRWILE